MSHSHIKRLYRPPFGLMLDLYHLTMAYGFWKEGLYGRAAVFHHFFRKTPFGNPYVLAGGLHLLIDLVEAFRFSVEDIQYLGSLKGSQGKPLFDEPFLNYLQRMEFSCDIDAVPEGKPVFPHQPMVRVTGPLLQAQIIESAILNLVNFSSLIATKASRMRRAAPDDSILDDLEVAGLFREWNEMVGGVEEAGGVAASAASAAVENKDRRGTKARGCMSITEILIFESQYVIWMY